MWTTVIAGYAAIVATGALALEVRRWLESGPRLSISIMPEAQTLNIPGTDGNTYLVAHVRNRGNVATTITHFALYEYANWLAWFRSKQSWGAIVLDPRLPGMPTNVPSTIQPGQVWSGIALHDDELGRRIAAGRLFVVIYASHSDKPMMKRVHIPAKPLKDVKEI